MTLPIVGDVPLVRESSSDVWTYDPKFLPRLPEGAIRGDITRQIYCCGKPRYAYVDEHRQCLQCDAEFVFAAAEQKYWYETLQFRLDSAAIRCLSCRRQRRSHRAVVGNYQATVPLRQSSDAGDLIEFASVLCEMIERVGTGKPAEVVAAARKARRAEPGWADPLYWEARGHDLDGRQPKAVELLGRFVAQAISGRATRRLVDDAQRRLADHHTEHSLG
ncbi:MAG: zinc-ribbon domain containing protein [Actinomycetota bacterium]